MLDMTEIIKHALSTLYTILIAIALIIWTSIVTAIITLFIIGKTKQSKRKSSRKQAKHETLNNKPYKEVEKSDCHELIQDKTFLLSEVMEDIPIQKNEQEKNEQYVINWRTDTAKDQRTYTRQEKEEKQRVARPYTKEEKDKHNQRIKEIGETGERTSNFKTLPIVVYGKQLRNLYMPTQYGETTEIDTVLISVSGIYVIETKNYSGKIYGREEQKNWVVWYSEEKQYPLYNPIKQNEAHLIALKSSLHKVNENYFFSIIVFNDKCNIQKIEYDRAKSLITKQNHLSEEFKEMLKQNEGKLSRQEVNDIFEKLKKFTNVSEEVKQRHIANIRQKRASAYYHDN